MKVLVDETYHKIDQNHSIFIVVHALATNRSIDEFMEWYHNSFLPDSMRYKNKQKVHYTDEDESVKERFVERVKALEVTAKVYLWRSVGAVDKAEVMKWSIDLQRQTDPGCEFFIEQSSNEYDSIVSEGIQVCSAQDMPTLAIPDIFAGVYLAKAFTRQQDNAASRRYSFLRPRLRLEVERGFDGEITKRTRAQILR